MKGREIRIFDPASGKSFGYYIKVEHAKETAQTLANTVGRTFEVQKLAGGKFRTLWTLLPRAARNPRELSVPEKHQKRIALQTLKYSDAGASIMGGMTKAEAREFLRRIGYSVKKIQELDRNPFAYLLSARARRGNRKFYFDGVKFIQQRQYADEFRSLADAKTTAKRILPRLPYSIVSIAVEKK